MITDRGKLHIKRYLAGYVDGLAGSLCVGIGETPPASTDYSLEHEILRVEIDSIGFDEDNDKIIFKGTIPSEFQGVIYEAGVYTQPSMGQYSSYDRSIFSFSTGFENWDTGTFVAGGRAGDDMLELSAAANTTTISSIVMEPTSFSIYSSADLFGLAFDVVDANTSAVSVRFGTDSSNYYQFSVTSPTAGYKVVEFTKGSATVVGSPDWNNIVYAAVVVQANSSGAATVRFDSVRVFDADDLNPEYALLARSVITPVTKTAGVPMDFEYKLGINI